MNVSEAVASRRAIRAFLDRPVDPAVLRRVIAAAQMAPSGYNFQPWEAVVVTGARLAELSRLMLAAAPQDPGEYQLVPKGLPQLYKDRRDGIVGRRMQAAGFQPRIANRQGDIDCLSSKPRFKRGPFQNAAPRRKRFGHMILHCIDGCARGLAFIG